MLKSGFMRALGTMSGTSLDGVDAAVLDTDGIDIAGFGPSDYRAYTDTERAVLRGHLGRWHDDDVIACAKVVEAAHIAVMAPFEDVDIAGFHGQTLAHDPGGRGTHQCGNGQHLADALGVPVAWDFRTNDVASGGQGAPLAPFFHFALGKWIGATAPVAFLNLGGVGNITWVDPRYGDPAEPGALIAFDTGPANAPINDLVQARRGLAYDKDGALGGAGVADPKIVAAFLTHPYFARPLPKSLDRDAFSGLIDSVAHLSDADAVATLTEIVAASVAHALAQCPAPTTQLLVCGGGRNNATMMRAISGGLQSDVVPVEAVGLNGDMLEAQAFAFLAVRAARGLPLSAPGTTGVGAPVSGGRVAVPTDSSVKLCAGNLRDL
ncbi:anhydro-N-acetylmuramic acid kinase [Loktanella sp. D2R18]|uniref:anhydro-N-acetylmuramic acid kinase n=1 Tax=Rhodobacterales TaxID=204455 RepID=UPI000DEAAE72|nr:MULTISPECIES: anhydro-N-acetylmuramic acid kinase [Rhodobacterales]MDO6590670.1 anhydro-N-acetylmuramic acid kinase [Yoonia sp. 1_MG-2023]RBW44704.1 anhydro-N-acetylmuramic acid kinase [Loktanella sp. D2R18]